MRLKFLAVPALVIVAGCASSPTAERAPENTGPRLMQAGYSAEDANAADLCRPSIVDDRTVLSDDCINVIDRSPMAGRQINAIGREIKHEARDLCENMVLPKCRRRY